MQIRKNLCEPQDQSLRWQLSQVQQQNPETKLLDMSNEVQKLKDEKIETLQATLQKKRSDKLELKAKVTELKCENAILKNDNTKLQNELDQKSKQVEDLTAQLHETFIKARPAETQEFLNEKEIELYQRRISDLEQSLKKSTEENLVLQHAGKNYETQIANLKKGFGKQISALRQSSLKIDLQRKSKLKFPVQGLKFTDIRHTPLKGEALISEKWSKCLKSDIVKCLSAASDGDDFVKDLFEEINKKCNYDTEIMFYESGHLHGLSQKIKSESYFEFVIDGMSFTVCFFRV